jgi:hypothetical protein
LEKLEIEETYFNIVKAINDKATTYIVLNKEKLKPFLLKSGMRQACPPFPLLFQHSPGILSQSNKVRKRNKRNSDR